MRRLVLVGIVAAGLVAVGSVTAAGDASRATVAVRSSSYGRILFDGRGFVLYAFTHDPRGKSTCSGACAKAWPPYLVHSRPAAVAGASGKLVGTVRRADGTTQVTYAGRPLYYYVGDTRPGRILCQNVTEFGGVWRVVRPDGRLVA